MNEVKYIGSMCIRQRSRPMWLFLLVSESNSRPFTWAFRMRFSAARYSFRNRSSWWTVPLT